MTGHRTLSPRDRRALSLGAAFIAGSLLLSRGLPAFTRFEQASHARWSEAAEAFARDRELSALVVRELAARPLGAGSDDGAHSPTFIASTAPAAAAALLTRVERLAAFCGARILTSEPRGDTTFVDDFAGLELRVSLTADGSALLRLLQELEASPEAIGIASISASQHDPDLARTEPETVRVDLILVALGSRAPPAALADSAR